MLVIMGFSVTFLVGNRRLSSGFKQQMTIISTTAVYNSTIVWYSFTYSHDNLGQEVTWCWCSMELVGLLVAVCSCSGAVGIDNGSSASISFPYWGKT